jgi:acetyl-CoA carboxylase carboxyltransferase component
MEKENDSKIEELEKSIDKQGKDIKKLKKKQARKMTAMKFVGVLFDPEKFKTGEAEINDALADGFEVIRDFETGGGIVMALGKWERKDEKVKNGWTK